MPESGSNNPSTGGPSGVAPYVCGSYAAAGSQLVTDKWNGDNDFEKWQRKMKAVLRRNRVHRVVFDSHLFPEDISDVEREEMEEWALTTLQLAMGENVISEISGETTAKGIWNKLEELYMKKSLTNRLKLVADFLYVQDEGRNFAKGTLKCV